MKPHPSNKTYSAADIERYHNGGMTAEQAHALERAALDDPFLADAVDGYVHTKTPAADVQALKQQLEPRTKRVVPLMGQRLVGLRVAAIAVLLAGFGWLAYTLTNRPEQKLAVQTERPAPSKSNAAQPAAPQDSFETLQQETSTPNTADETNNPEQKKEAVTKSRAGNQSLATKQAAEKNSDEGAQTFSKPHAADARLSKAESTKQSTYTFKARVVDAHNRAVPYASVYDTTKKLLAVTDTAGRFSASGPDSALLLSINSMGYNRLQTKLTPADTQTNLVLQPTAQSTSEVVVVSKKPALKNSSRVRLEAAEPLEGWNAFNAYVDQNLEPPETESGAQDKAVILSFNIDNKGNAVDITVEKPLCASCDSTAIRLIQQGGKWKKTKQSQKAKAYIRF